MKKRAAKRPKVAGEPQFVRLTDAMLQRVEAHRKAMERRAGVTVTKSDALRALIDAGLDAKAACLGDIARRIADA